MKRLDSQMLCDQIKADGYAIAPDIIGVKFLGRIRKEVARLVSSARRPMPPNDFSGFNTLRYFDLLNEKSIWTEVAAHPPVLEIIYRSLGRDCLLSVLCTALVGARERAQAIHCDDDIYALPRPHPHLVLNTLWALDDFKEENGATRVVTGSHLFNAPPKLNRTYGTFPLEMKRGSVAFILGTTYHGAGENITPRRRDAIIVNYCAGIMRQQENFMLELTRDRVRTFSPTVQRLVGYGLTRAGAGRIGFENPKDLVHKAPAPKIARCKD
jgi:ectoine hydroxylase-related dioxygenase (phytanoyl-CoA dioxygenase family)